MHDKSFTDCNFPKSVSSHLLLNLFFFFLIDAYLFFDSIFTCILRLTSMDTSNPSSSSHQWKYHVFLSFRGEDTRKSFTDHLHTALKQEGAITFRDKENLDWAFKSNRRIIVCYCHSLKKLCILNMVFWWTCKDHGMQKKDRANSFAHFLWCRSIWGMQTDGKLQKPSLNMKKISRRI